MALLAYLALTSEHGVQPRATLLELFWPELDGRHARQALSQAIHFLRRQLGSQVLVKRRHDEVGVDPDRIWCDAIEFDRALKRSAPAEALALYQGDLLPGFFVPKAAGFERWLEDERTRLRRLAAKAAELQSQQAEQAGDLDAAIRWARTALELAPYNEATLSRLVLLVNRSGDRGGALRIADRFARRLTADLDATLSADTYELIRTLEEPCPRGSQRAALASAFG